MIVLFVGFNPNLCVDMPNRPSTIGRAVFVGTYWGLRRSGGVNGFGVRDHLGMTTGIYTPPLFLQ